MDQLSNTIIPAHSKKTRRHYSREFKEKIVALCSQPGASIAGVACDYGINANLIHKWRREGGANKNAISTPGFLPLPATLTSSPATVHFEINSLSIDWPLSHIDQAIPWIRALQL